jgi:ParB family chromosome partitioning protein
MTTMVQLSLIERGIRIRDIAPDRIAPLVESMGEVGLLNPISIRPYPVVRGGRSRSGYILVSGLHRLEAATRLGWQEIAATVTDLSGPDIILAECDENLCRADLSTAERALFTRCRKAAYLEKHPETKHGAIGNGREKSCQHDNSTPSRFTADTAKKTGQSEATVQRDARRGKLIAPEVLNAVSRTKLDKGAVLDRIAREPTTTAQFAAIKSEQERIESSRQNRETNRRTALTEAQQFADWLLARSDLNELPQIMSWLEGCRSKDVIDAMRREAA